MSVCAKHAVACQDIKVWKDILNKKVTNVALNMVRLALLKFTVTDSSFGPKKRLVNIQSHHKS